MQLTRRTALAPAAPAIRIPWTAGAWGSRAVVGVAALAGVFLALPVVVLVARAVLDGSLGLALTERVVLEGLGLSLSTRAVSLVITVALGLPLAVVLARRTFRGIGLVEAIVDLPIGLPPSVAGLALLLVLGRRGLLGGRSTRSDLRSRSRRSR